MRVVKESKVAVLVGCYNHEKFIIECLESIFKQSYKNIDVFISDDCSSDNSVDVIKSYIQKNGLEHSCYLYKQKKNLGIAKNYNFLFDVVRRKFGVEYVIPFAGDDLMAKDKVRLQVESLDKSTSHLVCYSNMLWFDSDSGNKILEHFNFFFKPKVDIKDIISEAVIPTPTLCLRREALDKVRYNEDFYFICDYLFVVELVILGGGVSYVDQCLVRYRKHGNSVMDTRTFSSERRAASKYIAGKYGFSTATRSFASTALFDDMVEALYKNENRSFTIKFIKLLPRFFSSKKWFFRFLKTFYLLKQRFDSSRNGKI